jgi:hypothetical protein
VAVYAQAAAAHGHHYALVYGPPGIGAQLCGLGLDDLAQHSVMGVAHGGIKAHAYGADDDVRMLQVLQRHGR